MPAKVIIHQPDIVTHLPAHEQAAQRRRARTGATVAPTPHKHHKRSTAAAPKPNPTVAPRTTIKYVSHLPLSS